MPEKTRQPRDGLSKIINGYLAPLLEVIILVNIVVGNNIMKKKHCQVPILTLSHPEQLDNLFEVQLPEGLKTDWAEN